MTVTRPTRVALERLRTDLLAEPDSPDRVRALARLDAQLAALTD